MSNLVVTTIMNNASTAMQSTGFYGNSTQTGVNCTLYGYMNNSPYTLANLATGSYSTSTYRPTVAFYMAECAVEAECGTPTVIVEQEEAYGAEQLQEI